MQVRSASLLLAVALVFGGAFYGSVGANAATATGPTSVNEVIAMGYSISSTGYSNGTWYVVLLAVVGNTRKMMGCTTTAGHTQCQPIGE